MKPEDFYKEEFAKDYELIKDLKEQPFFNFRSMMEFAEMYHTKQCAINGVSNNEACVVSVCEDCKIPFTYDWHLEYNTCPKCGKDEAN